MAIINKKEKNSDKAEQDVKQEMEQILDHVVSKRPSRIEEQPDLSKNWCFHNTKKLLQRYRSTLMCIAVALDDLDEDCLGTLGVRFSALNEFSQQVDIDLSNTYLESRIRTMQRNKLMLQYIDKAIKSMRAYAKNGEEFYWILYYKYLSSNDDICHTDGEVVEKLRGKGLPVSNSTFYRRCNLAIETLSGILWGFTARDTWSLLKLFEG